MTEERRELSEKERELAEKNLVLLEDEIEYLEQVELPKVQLVLDSADIVLRRQVAQTEFKKNELESQLEEHKTSLDVLKDQIENGVVQKEQTED